MKIMTKVAAVLAAFLAAVPVAAQAQTEAPRVVAVHYGDLDLRSARGRSALDHRIRHAVRAACGEASEADLRGQNQAASCRDDLNLAFFGQRNAVLAARGSGNVLLARR